MVTVHDLAFLRYPQTFPRHGRRFHERGLELARRDASVVVTASEFTRTELTNEGFEPERVVTIPHGSDVLPVLSKEEVDWQVARAGITGRYVLTVGTVEPRKNLALLIDAMQEVRRATDPAIELVVVGPTGWGQDPDRGAPGVRWLGMVDEAGLEALYRRATVCCQLSLYEGFGLPALEAMTRDCPVVVSGSGALEEVTGGAGIVVDPQDPEAVVDAITAVVDDPEQRSEMVASGRLRAAHFSWDRSALAHVEAYRRALA